MTTSRAPAIGRGRELALPEEGAREGQHDQRDRRHAHREQEPVADPPPADRLVGNALQKHQRRKHDDALPLALNEMDQDRNGDGAKGEEERGGEEGHRL